VAPSFRLSDKQCALLFKAVSGGTGVSDAVTPPQFAAFFAVQLVGTLGAPLPVQGAGSGGAAGAAGGGSLDKKLARWNKMKAARRVGGGEKEAAGGGGERERLMQLEAARLYRTVHRDSKIKEVP
jgi:hypothetical protein